jgi:hypothetical protein
VTVTIIYNMKQKKTIEQIRAEAARRKANQRKRDAALVLEITGFTIPQLIRLVVKRRYKVVEA